MNVIHETTEQITIAEAIRLYAARHPGQPFTAADIINRYGNGITLTGGKSLRRSILSQLSSQTLQGRLHRVGDGIYSSPPEKAATVDIGTPTTIGPVDEPHPHIGTLYGEEHDRTLAACRQLIDHAADLLDQLGADYQYSRNPHGMLLEWRRQP